MKRVTEMEWGGVLRGTIGSESLAGDNNAGEIPPWDGECYRDHGTSLGGGDR